MSEFAPMTKLDAVNIILNSMGEPKVISLDATGVDAENALDLLQETSRDVQLQGWWWNTSTVQYPIDTNGFIQLPINIAAVRSANYNYLNNYVQRGQRLYDQDKQTFVFSGSVWVEQVLFLDWIDLPDSVHQYIAYRAAVIAQERMIGAPDVDGYLVRTAQGAWLELLRDETKNNKANIFRDNWSSNQIVQRDFFRSGAYRSG